MSLVALERLDPFLYLKIEEIPGMGHSTSEEGRKSLVKLMRDKKWSEIFNQAHYVSKLGL